MEGRSPTKHSGAHMTGMRLNERRSYNISAVTLDVQQWTTMVQVVERRVPQISNPDRVPPGSVYRRHVVTDDEGTRVSVLVYGSDVLYFNRNKYLLPFRRYKISNAALKVARGTFKVSQYDYIWVVNKKTPIEAVHEAVPPALPCTFETTLFRDISRFADKQTSFNIKAIVVEALGDRDITDTTSVTDLIVVNQEKIPMVLSIWTSIEDEEPTEILFHVREQPLIIALNVKATTFYGLSMSSKWSTCILMDPPLPEGHELRDWYNENREDIRRLIAMNSYSCSDLLIPRPNPADIVPVADVASKIESEKTLWKSGTLKLMKGQKGYWFPACSGCHKTVNGDIGWIISCPCSKELTDIEARCRIGVFIRDQSAVVQAALLSPDAEKFFAFPSH